MAERTAQQSRWAFKAVAAAKGKILTDLEWEKLRRRIFSYAWSLGDNELKPIDLEDISQEFVLRLLDPRFRQCLFSSAQPESYLLKSLENAVNDWKRARRRSHRFSRNYAKRRIGRIPTTWTDLDTDNPRPVNPDRQEEIERMRLAIGRLRPADIELIKLAYFDDLTLSQIAQKLGKRPNTVAQRLVRVRDRLRKLLT